MLELTRPYDVSYLSQEPASLLQLFFLTLQYLFISLQHSLYSKPMHNVN